MLPCTGYYTKYHMKIRCMNYVYMYVDVHIHVFV